MSKINVETRLADSKLDLIPVIAQKLQERFEATKTANPRGYLDAFESRLDLHMLEIADELGLHLKMTDSYIFCDDMGQFMKEDAVAEQGV